MHLLLWRNVMNSFVWVSLSCEEQLESEKSKVSSGDRTSDNSLCNLAPWTTRSRLTDLKMCFKVLHNLGIWVEPIHGITCLKKIMVRCVFKLNVRQNLHFFNQCIYYLLLFTELCRNTPNHDQFNTCIGMCWFYSYEKIVLEFKT